MTAPILLSSKEVASFVTHGCLRLDEVVPPEIARAALAELTTGAAPSPFGAALDRPEASWPGRPLADFWRDSPGIGAALRLPRVAGVIDSLLGPGALYDHHYAHVIAPGQAWSQPWHADAILDTRPLAFDLQLFFFFHDTLREMGGTMILPGSHLRRVNEAEIGRYQNFRGQLATVCRAGTVLICHHGIWHCGQPNRTSRPRTMLKVRVGPAHQQARHFNLSDVADRSIGEILRHAHAFTGNESRMEIINRIKLWRTLSGDDAFDLDYWMGRMTPRL